MSIQEILDSAIAHAERSANTSALLAAADAQRLAGNGNLADARYAARRALDSLAHSVGMFHPDYKAAHDVVTRRFSMAH